MNELKAKILNAVKSDLADIERELKRNLTPYLDIVAQTAGHILFAGGKRLRPLLMVLGARACGYSGNEDKVYSTIFEYLHSATLLHDDIVDGSGLRRGKPVAHMIFGNTTTVLTGDFLLARSLSLATQTKKIEVIRVIAEITENMSQGELHQLLNKGNVNLSEREYMEIIRRKTAVLLQGACIVGALISDAEKEKQDALAIYGSNLGIAFQMADDLLDYVSSTETIGKPIGADLKEGKLTLPVIYSLQKASSQDRLRMEQIIRHADFTTEDFYSLVDMLEQYGGISYTRQIAMNHVRNAKQALSVFEHSQTVETLADIADYSLMRDH